MKENIMFILRLCRQFQSCWGESDQMIKPSDNHGSVYIFHDSSLELFYITNLCFISGCPTLISLCVSFHQSGTPGARQERYRKCGTTSTKGRRSALLWETCSAPLYPDWTQETQVCWKLSCYFLFWITNPISTWSSLKWTFYSFWRTLAHFVGSLIPSLSTSDYIKARGTTYLCFSSPTFKGFVRLTSECST